MNSREETHTTYKIGISGSFGGLNLGDEAILQCMIEQLRKSVSAEITVFSRNAEDTQRRHRVERVVAVRDKTRTEVQPELENLDLFILGGGGILFDADAKTYLRELEIACQAGVPGMLYAVGVGPLADVNTQRYVRDILSMASAVTVRERGAKKALEDIGLDCDIVVTADPAFLLEPEPFPRGTLERELMHGSRRLVGMSVREPGVAAPDIDEDFYHDLLANAADFIIDRYNADVVFIPMERSMLDTQHSHAVISQMLHAQRAWVLKGRYTSAQILSLMGNLDFAVGMRLHFLIFAALQAVPFVALPYSGKVIGLLHDFGIEMPPIRLVDSGRLIAYIDRSWDKRSSDQVQNQTTPPRSAGESPGIKPYSGRTSSAENGETQAGREAVSRKEDMPPLKRPSSMTLTTLPPKEVPIFAETEVLVIGGGPAGLGAALGAAEAGVDVLLAERYGFLGGSATAALVITFMSSHTQEPAEGIGIADQLFPKDHGTGRPVVGGILDRLLDRLIAHGGAIPPSFQTGYVCPFDPETFKTVALEMLDEGGVDYLLHALATDVLGNEEIEGIVFETKSGPGVVKARVIIDCTGDGDVAARAGATFEVGRSTDGLVQPMTLMFRMSGFQPSRFKDYVIQNPDDWHGVNGLWKLIERAKAKGDLDMPRDDILLFGTSHEQELSIDSTRISQVLGTDVWDLTHAETQGRHQMEHIASFLKRYVPGFEETCIAQSAATVGVRETRRIIGEYRLTGSDVLEARKFDDVIARGTYPLDIHDPEGKGTLLKRLPPGEAYDIPLRSLLPKGLNNLLVAGRCISGTHEAHSSYRIMPLCLATGQAAGVCAALAVRRSQYPRNVPVAQVQQELIRQKAKLRD